MHRRITACVHKEDQPAYFGSQAASRSKRGRRTVGILHISAGVETILILPCRADTVPKRHRGSTSRPCKHRRHKNKLDSDHLMHWACSMTGSVRRSGACRDALRIFTTKDARAQPMAQRATTRSRIASVFIERSITKTLWFDRIQTTARHVATNKIVATQNAIQQLVEVELRGHRSLPARNVVHQQDASGASASTSANVGARGP